MNQKGAIKDARTLGTPKMLLLGLQHMFAMFGATILVPILVNDYFEGEGLSVQVTLFCAGVGTLLFHLITKRKVPAFLGSSFAFLGGFSMVAQLNSGIYADMTMGENLSPDFDVRQSAADFETTVAAGLTHWAASLIPDPTAPVCLAGGVFLNRTLSRDVPALLARRGFTCYLPQKLPPGDGAVSFGQIVVTRQRLMNQGGPQCV